MVNKTLTSLAFAAGCVLALGAMPSAHAQYANPQVVTNGPQASRGDFGDWSARRNVIESRHYDALLETNWRFRHARTTEITMARITTNTTTSTTKPVRSMRHLHLR